MTKEIKEIIIHWSENGTLYGSIDIIYKNINPLDDKTIEFIINRILELQKESKRIN